MNSNREKSTSSLHVMPSGAPPRVAGSGAPKRGKQTTFLLFHLSWIHLLSHPFIICLFIIYYSGNPELTAKLGNLQVLCMLGLPSYIRFLIVIKIPERSNLRGERFNQFYGCREYSPPWQGKHGRAAWSVVFEMCSYQVSHHCKWGSWVCCKTRSRHNL